LDSTVNTGRLAIIVAAVAFVAACGSNGGSARGRGGSSAGGAGSAGSGGSAGSIGSAGTTGNAGSSGANGGTGGAGGDGGGGGASAGASGGAGNGGAAGGSAGGGGAGGGLPDGTSQLDLIITSGGESSHVTTCKPATHSASMRPQANGISQGSIFCQPEPEGTLAITQLTLGANQAGIGQHDVNAIKATCELTGCTGVGSFSVAFTKPDGTKYLTTYDKATKTGTFTLDEFTEDGRSSGSLDITLSENGTTVIVKGRFEANFRDCGPITSQPPTCATN
jgi:hypothetical protein